LEVDSNKSHKYWTRPLNNQDFDTQWFGPYGLIEDTFFNVLFYIVGEIVFTAIDFVQCGQYVQRWFHKKRGDKSYLT